MDGNLATKLQDLGRSIVGAMVIGMPILYTMETWWLAWRLPAWHILLWSLSGLAIISVVVHQIGFRKDVKEKNEPWWTEITDFFELLGVTVVASLIVLVLFGIVEWGDDLGEVVRLGLIQVVPLGIGAAITNEALRGAEGSGQAADFPREMAIFAVGALVFALQVAPTEEMELMAAHAEPPRLVFVVIAALLLTWLALYVLHFRGSESRMKASATRVLQWGEVFTGYAIAVLVSAFLLWGYGHFEGAGTIHEAGQKIVVLSFIASMGGAAARVAI